MAQIPSLEDQVMTALKAIVERAVREEIEEAKKRLDTRIPAMAAEIGMTVADYLGQWLRLKFPKEEK